MHQNIIITGASGFIGQALIKEFIKKKLNFKAFSRKKSKYSSLVKRYSDIIPVKNSILIHLAQSNKSKKNYINEIETINKLTKKNWKHIIFASSTKLYCDMSTKPHKESEKINPYDNYTKMKKLSEEIVLKKGGTVFRISNVYGSRMSKKTVIGLIRNKILRRKKMILREIQSVRDFIFIEDVIRAFIKAVSIKPKKILNISYGRSHSIEEVVKTSQKILKLKTIQFQTKQKLKKNSIVLVDNNRAKTLLRWNPKYSLNKGLKKILLNR